MVDAIVSGQFPPDLEAIYIVERDARRVSRLRDIARTEFPQNQLSSKARTFRNATSRANEFASVGFDSSSKPYAFVAMPINDQTGDLFHYGISQAVESANLLCERIDIGAATGDILARIKARIAGATFVIADLSGKNANVYLEVGYAWGQGIPTVLLVHRQELDNLGFDVKGQRCVVYESVKSLESSLAAELRVLRSE